MEWGVTTSLEKLTRQLSQGVLAFPATPFSADLSLDEVGLATHVTALAAERPVALVPAGGAGELFSLSVAEHSKVIGIASRDAGAIPVIAGVGGSLPIALEMARNAETAGAEAILLLPPYLITPDQAGLAAYVETICRAIGIGVIVYSRDNAIFAVDTMMRLAGACSNLIGLKDGTGDFEALSGLKREAGDRLAFINGAPTAEILARQYRAIGIRAYSSAAFAFVPALAKAFYAAMRNGDEVEAERIINEFYLPLARIRNRRRGYAVSIIKAGLRVVGRPAGPVRPPLIDLDESETAELDRLVASVRISTRQETSQ
jgi:5-dehydro-4-deoxyglucarate dehydratase